MTEPKAIGRGHEWQLRTDIPPDVDFVAELVQSLRLSPIAARILAGRGVQSVEEARVFLDPATTPLYNPFQMADMFEAVTTIQRVVDNRGLIWVYGDYDVDGATGTALLVEYLREWGARVEYYVPHRVEEGYGLNTEALKQAADDGVALVVTVDCGISAVEQAEFAASMGLQLVITDHHEPGPELPVAAAVVNPKRPDCPYPFDALAGVGVAFKLTQAYSLLSEGVVPEGELLPEEFRMLLADSLDLVVLGTIADVVPLTGENRFFAAVGLERLNETGRRGLLALRQVAGLSDKELTSGRVAFGLAPRINAAGRMAHATDGVRLLLTTDANEAEELARGLDLLNQERQKLEDNLVGALERRLEARPELADSYFLVFDGEGWHSGVVGIAASRICDRVHRPVAVVSVDPETGMGQASVRGISGYDVRQALEVNGDLLVKFGGHSQAAGFTVETARIPDVRQALDEHARQCLSFDQLRGQRLADAVVILPDVDERLVEELGRFAPCGVGNPRPTLLARELRVVEARAVGRGQRHLKLRLQDVIEGLTMGAIGFNLAESAVPEPGEYVDAVFSPQASEWQGRKSIELHIYDLRSTRVVRRRARRAELQRILQLNWEQVRRMHPDPVVLRELYVMFKKLADREPLLAGGSELVQSVHELSGREYAAETIEAALAIFSELDLAHKLRRGDRTMWILAGDDSQRRDLYESPRFVRGELARESVRQFLRHASGAGEDDLEEIVASMRSG